MFYARLRREGKWRATDGLRNIAKEKETTVFWKNILFFMWCDVECLGPLRTHFDAYTNMYKHMFVVCKKLDATPLTNANIEFLQIFTICVFVWLASGAKRETPKGPSHEFPIAGIRLPRNCWSPSYPPKPPKHNKFQPALVLKCVEIFSVFTSFDMRTALLFPKHFTYSFHLATPSHQPKTQLILSCWHTDIYTTLIQA